MTEQLVDLLVRDAVTRYCAGCLANAADISPADAQAAVEALALHESLEILHAECDLCGRRGYVIRRRRPPKLFD